MLKLILFYTLLISTKIKNNKLQTV